MTFREDSLSNLVSPELVSLVTETVEDLAKAKGFATYPKESGVRLVLQSLKIVKIAVDKKNGT